MTHRKLYASISERWRPEDVAKTILEVHGDRFARHEQRALRRVASVGWGWSSMSSRFAPAIGLDRQVAVAKNLFDGVQAPAELDSPTEIRAYLDRLNGALHKEGRDFKMSRLNRSERRAVGIVSNHRAYNKRFRLIQRMESKYERWMRVRTMRELAQIAKTRLACRVTWEDFSTDVDSACFIAYMTARLGLRSTFTWGKQQRAFDAIADMLFSRCRRSPEMAMWWPMAHVYPSTDVLVHLDDGRRGQLLALWFSVMKSAAEILEETSKVNDIDLESLVVRRGNDSSTWNEAAGAFNKARDGWINTLYALGMADVLERFAPGKMMRLMAADVVYMHRHFGSGDVEPDTKVWNDLALPWEVVLGSAQCSRSSIETACWSHGVHGKGWIAPRPKSVAPFSPTPELVHGVSIGCPHLASILRGCGYFSGPSKGVSQSAPVDIDRTVVNDTVVVNERLSRARAKSLH